MEPTMPSSSHPEAPSSSPPPKEHELPASGRDGRAHEATLAQHRPHRCPWWLSWVLVNPIRRWLTDPDRLLGSFVRPSDRVLEIGPGPGFYSIPLAQRVGSKGKVVCVDVQAQMLESLRKRLARSDLGDRVETRLCSGESLGIASLAGSIDRAILIYVLHEVPDPRRTLAEIHDALRPGGELLLVEPKGHCSSELFAAELWAAEQVGLSNSGVPLWEGLGKHHAAVLVRPPSRIE